MARYSTRDHVKRAIKIAVNNQEKVSSELDGILQEYTQSYYSTQEINHAITQEALNQRKETTKTNIQYLTVSIEYSLLLRDMLIRLSERL